MAPQNQQYAQPSDLPLYGMSQAALSHPSCGTTVQNAALASASGVIDSYLRAKYVTPLVAGSWGPEIKKYCCWLASYDLVVVRGFNPAHEADQSYLDRYDRAIKWLKDVSNGVAHPDILPSSANAQQAVTSVDAQPSAESPAPINSTGGQTRGTNCR